MDIRNLLPREEGKTLLQSEETDNKKQNTGRETMLTLPMGEDSWLDYYNQVKELDTIGGEEQELVESFFFTENGK